MRDIKRIKPLLSKIEVLWRECPDLRFAQVVEKIKHEVGKQDIFNVEDDLIEDAVDRLMDKKISSMSDNDLVMKKEIEEWEAFIKPLPDDIKIQFFEHVDRYKEDVLKRVYDNKNY